VILADGVREPVLAAMAALALTGALELWRVRDVEGRDQPSSSSRPASSITGTPSFSALASLEPGDSPATR
jgi:hypothetical protein